MQQQQPRQVTNVFMHFHWTSEPATGPANERHVLPLFSHQPSDHQGSGRQEDGHSDWLSGDHHPVAGHHHLPHPLVPVCLQGAGEGEQLERQCLKWLKVTTNIVSVNQGSAFFKQLFVM